MKRLRVRIGAVIMCMMFLLSSCGEQPIALTDKEEDIIVNYASHIVSKYNKRQNKGIVELPPEAPATEEVPDTETDEPPIEEESGTEEGAAGGQTMGEAEETSYVSLSEAAGLTGVEITYMGAEVKDSYMSGDYAAMDAAEGRQYMVLYFTLRNTGTEAVMCDMLTAKPVFKATVNHSVETTAELTILPNDFGTFQAELGAGQTAEAVLLFEVPAGSVSPADSIVLDISKNGTKLTTKL